LNQRIPRRKALSDLTKIAGAAALSFSIGGLTGYPLASRFRGTVTNTGGIIDKWERKTDAYCSSFLTQISIGLRENEIAQSPLNRGGLKILWRDLLEDVELKTL